MSIAPTRTRAEGDRRQEVTLPTPRGGNARKTRRRVDALAGWALVAPALVLFTTFVGIPMGVSLGLGLFNWSYFDTPTWVGLDNFLKLVVDENVWQSLGVTIRFVILGVPAAVVVSFMLAVLLNYGSRLVRIVRVLYFIPIVTSISVAGVIWSFVYNPRQGPVGTLLRGIGIETPSILTSKTLALPGLTLILLWMNLPVLIILYLAALQRISPDMYDAAALDGAGPWRVLWQVTWPNVKGTTMAVLILSITAFAAGSLDIALIMTQGGPLDSTRSLALYSYHQAFTVQEVGYANAVSFVQLVLVVGLAAMSRLLLGRNADESR